MVQENYISTNVIEDIRQLASDFDGDGNGMCGMSDNEIVAYIKGNYPFLYMVLNR